MKIFKSNDPVELFNIAFTGVLAQGKPAILDGSCIYSLPNDSNTKCGVGHCLSDATFDCIESADREGHKYEGGYKCIAPDAGVLTIIRTLDGNYGFELLEEEQHETLKALLAPLQRAHDCAAKDTSFDDHADFSHEFVYKMREVARKVLKRTDMDDKLGLPTS